MLLTTPIFDTFQMCVYEHFRSYSTVPNKRVAVIRVLPKEFPKKYNSQGSNNCLSYDI